MDILDRIKLTASRPAILLTGMMVMVMAQTRSCCCIIPIPI